MRVHIRIVTCPEWGAKPPKAGLVLVGPPRRIIFHHTAGHHAEVSDPRNESLAEAIRYARDIQAFHMAPPRNWNDSGHNFLVTRAGQILQGRWLTVSAIEAGHMVVSAHCPGQNDQVGIEHEHAGTEPMPHAQMHASAQLQAWIAWKLGHRRPLPVDPHRKYFATSCPANLTADIARVRNLAAQVLAVGGL